MYKRVLAFGDSFTFGYDLKDCNDISPSSQTYAALLAQWLGVPYYCHAVGHNANQSIVRNILHTDILSDDLVIIMWTFEDRQDFLFEGEEGWRSISADPPTKFSEFFYKHIDCNPAYFQYLSHKEIWLAQTYLDKIGVKHIHCCATTSLIQSINYRNTALTNVINTADWISMPGPEGFYEWAKEQKLLIPPGGHANEIAHRQLFELIKQHMPG